MHMRTSLPATGVFLLLAPLAAAQPATAPTARPALSCDALTSLALPDGKITSAIEVGSDPTRGIHAPHCKVGGVIGTEIHFEVLLPDAWNFSFLMGGGGGFVEGVSNDQAASVDAGYASAGTDTGHQSSGLKADWALNNHERQINYGHLGIHRTAAAARAIITAYYATAPRHAYFASCSNGGRQGLMEAQRYPDDFDGIVAGAPAYDFTNIAASFLKNIRAAFPTPDAQLVRSSTLKLLDHAALDACDAADGVTDGLIGEPVSCRVPLDAIKTCGAEVAADCITAPERAAIAAIYGPLKGATGEIYPGQPPGAEGDKGGWIVWITGGAPGFKGFTGVPSLQFGFSTEYFKYFVYNDASWDYTKYDMSRAMPDSVEAGKILNADSVDLTAFKAHGGKLIIWHGWADPALNAESTIHYYKRLLDRDPHAADYARLFLMPGVLHCGGGPGPDRADWIAALTDWTEHDRPPTRVVASKLGADQTPVRTRPLCAYPERPVYNGTGNPDDERSFECRAR
jgi:feruloyl esterase